MSQGSKAAQDQLFLLDTSVIIHLVRGAEVGQRILRSHDLIHCQPRPLVSVVSLAEVRVMAEMNQWGEVKRQILERTLQSLVVVDINHPLVIDAYVHIALLARQHPKGARQMGNNDLWIAACAAAAGAFLLTTDDDFRHLIPAQVHGVVIPVISPAAPEELQ
jgi:predicted nucleic acid-binding protein